MPTINDYKKAALKTLTGSSGDITTLEYKWLRNIVSPYKGSIPDMWRKYLSNLGYTTGTLPDRFMKYLGSLGYTGSLNKRWYNYWKDNSPFNLTLLTSFPSSINNAYWTKDRTTVTTGRNDPWGGTTAEALFETATTNSFDIGTNVNLTSGTTYVLECIVKPIGGRNIQMSVYDNSFANGYGVNFNLVNGVVGPVLVNYGTIVSSPSSTITPVANGYYRCRMKFTAANSFTAAFIFWNIQLAPSTNSYLGDVTKGLDFESLGLYQYN